MNRLTDALKDYSEASVIQSRRKEGDNSSFDVSTRIAAIANSDGVSLFNE